MGHLGQVLVGGRGGVLRGRVHRRAVGAGGVVGDLLFAAAAVSGQRMGGQRVVGGQNAARDQRVHERAEAARVAARDGDAGRAGDGLAPVGGQLGKAVDPARRGAVRGRRVDDAHMTSGHRDGLARGVVGQAEDGDVGVVDARAPRGGVLALLLADGEKLDVRPRGQPFGDAQSGRAGRAVYKHFCHESCSSIFLICSATRAGAVPPCEFRSAIQVCISSASYTSASKSGEKRRYSSSGSSASVFPASMA